MTESAASFKERGNAFFKEGNFAEAAILYSKAEAASSKDHVFPSNLSAALFELGDYCGCFNAICRSWRLLSVEDNAPLAFRLSVRLAKAVCQGSRKDSKELSADTINQHAEIINSAELVALRNGASDTKRLWHECRLILSESADAASNACQRFCDLPLLRKSVLSDLEYFTTGMDNVFSFFHNWGPQDSAKHCPLNLDKLSKSQLSCLSFFHGGVGDARHVYGTLIGARKAYQGLSKAKKAAFHCHITLLDIHPGVFARNLCILMLIDSLGKCDTASLEATEIRATLFYTYVGTVMPAYCHERLQRTITLLMGRLSHSPPHLPSWLHISSNSIPGVLDALSYWSTIGSDIMTVRKMQGIRKHDPRGHQMEVLQNPNVSLAYKQAVELGLRDLPKEVADVYDSASPANLNALAIGWAQLGEEGAREMRKNRRQMIEGMLQMRLEGNGPARMQHERLWYDITGGFIPPKVLWNRHEWFESSSIIKHTDEPIPLDLRKKLRTQVDKRWKPNPTLMDRKTMERTDNQGRQHTQNMFDTPRRIHEFLFQQYLDGYMNPNGDPPDAPAFSHVSAFFDEVVKSLMVLNGRVQLETLCGELTQELSKMVFGSDSKRPKTFPRVYSRAYLSNVPDYTHGPLNTIVHSLPIIQRGPQFGVASNCLLNSGAWSSDEEFFYTYTLLNLNDIPRYLNCELIRKDNAGREMIVLGNSVLPRPLLKLASRQELMKWLTQVLICTLFPGSSRSFAIELPNNLVAFFAVLRRLPIIGYPSHWVAEFVQNLVDDSLVTDTPLHLGTLPISPVDHIDRRTSMRKIQLHPWIAEMETILTIAHQGFPFSIIFPSEFDTKHEDIGMFEATVTLIVPLKLINDRVPAVSLLVFKSKNGEDDIRLLGILPDVLDGRSQPDSSTCFVITSLELADFTSCRIHFRLSQKRVLRMVTEGAWFLVAYRTDAQSPITSPLPVSAWKAIDAPST